MRKPKRVTKVRVRRLTKDELEIERLKAELDGASKIINAMQTEIKQLTQMHRTQLQIIDNLSSRVRDDS